MALFFTVKFTIDKPLLMLGIEHIIIIIVDMVFLFLCYKQLMIIECKLLLLLLSYFFCFIQMFQSFIALLRLLLTSWSIFDVSVVGR